MFTNELFIAGRPEAFEKHEPAETTESEELPAPVVTLDQAVNGKEGEQEEEEEEEKAPLTGAEPTMKANGFTMLDRSFAETMHLNRNRRKGVFDEDEDDEEDSD